MNDPSMPRRVWGRRKGPSLSARQTELMEKLLPHLALPLSAGEPPKDYFVKSVEAVWLEIGFGAGEHLLHQAQANPHIGLIGAEPYIAGIAKFLSRFAKELSPEDSVPRMRDSNIRIFPGDAHELLAALPEASLSRVFLLHPDPWPKTRHHKRRFIQRESLDALARLLVSGGELRVATDHRDYALWALEHLRAHPDFAWTARRATDWREPSADWPQTGYAAKAGREGRACIYLRFRRR